MSSPTDKLSAIAAQAKGRCHSCFNSRHYDLPSGSRYWCRAFAVEMDEPTHQRVKNCPRWRSYVPSGQSLSAVANNPLLHDLIQQEDLLFWRLKYHLETRELDLKTVIALAHPGTSPSQDLKWISTLESRFDNQDPQTLEEVIAQLRALGYSSLCLVVEQAVGTLNRTEWITEDA